LAGYPSFVSDFKDDRYDGGLQKRVEIVDLWKVDAFFDDNRLSENCFYLKLHMRFIISQT